MRKLIINADDWGLSPLFNKGILELIRENVVTSATVMIDRKFLEPKKLLKVKNISIGLHLELPQKATLEKIESQIKKFKKIFGKLPSHLDGHHHMHLAKYNFPSILKVAKKYNLPVRSLHKEEVEKIKKIEIKTPEKFISWHPKRKEKLLKKLKQPEKKIIELVCHPGYFDKNCYYPYNKNREKELKILKSREFKKNIEKFGLINYSQF